MVRSGMLICDVYHDYYGNMGMMLITPFAKSFGNLTSWVIYIVIDFLLTIH